LQSFLLSLFSNCLAPIAIDYKPGNIETINVTRYWPVPSPHFVSLSLLLGLIGDILESDSPTLALPLFRFAASAEEK
jgi:hypothetical protein